MERDKVGRVINLTGRELNLEKVVISCGFGRMGKEDEREGFRVLTAITGQVPIPTLARKSISNFNIRRGMRSGLKVTLRGDRAVWFLEKIIHVVWPNRSDFKSLEPNYNGRSFNFSLTSLHLLPEIDETDIRGLNVSMVFNDSGNLERALKLLRIPLRGISNVS